MKKIASIIHNEDDIRMSNPRRVVLSVDENLNLYADEEPIESPKFKNLEEAQDYIHQLWGAADWDLEWLIENPIW